MADIEGKPEGLDFDLPAGQEPAVQGIRTVAIIGFGTMGQGIARRAAAAAAE